MTTRKKQKITKPKRAKSRKKPPVSTSQMAERLGISSKALRGYFERGQIPIEAYEANGAQRVILDPDLVAATVRRIMDVDPPRPGRPASGATGGDPLSLPERFDVEDPGSWPLDLDGLKIVREWWIARHAKRKDDLAAGELVRADDMRREIFGACRVARDHILKIPDGVAADLAAMFATDDVGKVADTMRITIDRILHDMANALSRIAAPDTPEEIESAGAHG